ncbi:MAG: trimethylamine methyltransferase family protein [Clostridiales Family XIII bacterium]|nr:trimethylamine methyltransferase family protein [Clostridiales Family XIII bacterium]
MSITRSLYTKAGFQVNQNIFWQMLSDDQCEEIYLKTVELLERTGVDVKDEKARKVFADGGCWVEGERVRIPSVKIDWAVQTAPSRVTITDRAGKRAMMLEATNAHFGPGFGNTQTIDVESGEIRATVLEDVVKTAKVCDGLPYVQFVSDNGTPTDAPAGLAELYSFKTLADNTAKPVLQQVNGPAQAQAVIDMAFEIRGGAEKFQQDPFAVLYTSNDQPLEIQEAAAGVVRVAAENGFPVVFSNNLITGLTAPQKSASAILVGLASSLAALLLTQLVRPGTPFVAGGFFTTYDKDNDLVPYGAPEISLLGAGFVGVLRWLRLPSFSNAGGTDAKTSDAQLGMESAMSLLLAGLSGANLIYGAGQTDTGNVSSLYAVVMADEIIGMTKRIIKGVGMDEDKLARGVIDEVQPGGHYLGAAHTKYYFKTEQFWPTLMNRKRIDDWIAEGSKSLGVRTEEKTKKLLNNYKGQPLEADVSSRLAQIIDGYAAKLGGGNN